MLLFPKLFAENAPPEVRDRFSFFGSTKLLYSLAFPLFKICQLSSGKIAVMFFCRLVISTS